MNNELKTPISGDSGVRTIPVSRIKPAEYNPRKTLKLTDPTYHKIKASLESFGLVEPLVVNKDMTLISGHQRYAVMCDLGYEEVPCVVLDLDKEQEKTLNIAMNKISGEWDKDKLSELLAELQTADVNQFLTGFDCFEFDRLTNYYHHDECEEDDFDEDESIKEPFMKGSYVPLSRSGDIWYLSQHRVLCGDATLPISYERLMGKKKAQMILTDPPYGTSTVKTGGPLLNDDLSPDDYAEFLISALRAMKGSLGEHGVLYMFYANGSVAEVAKALKRTGWHVSCGCVWVKDVPVFTKYGDYSYGHENIVYAWPSNHRHNWYGSGGNSTVWNCDRPRHSIYHSTVKPLKLLQIPIGNSSVREQIVLDPFLGSGSTLIACDQMHRICYGMEMDRRYVDLVVIRYLARMEMQIDSIKLERKGEVKRLSDLERCAEFVDLAASMRSRGCVKVG